jgi:hypothetical protein
LQGLTSEFGMGAGVAPAGWLLIYKYRPWDPGHEHL